MESGEHKIKITVIVDIFGSRSPNFPPFQSELPYTWICVAQPV
jgi:hypothetical protein